MLGGRSGQKDEDDHKNWCDKEIDQTTKMKEDKEDRKEELETSMAQLSAEIEELSTSIKDNSVRARKISKIQIIFNDFQRFSQISRFSTVFVHRFERFKESKAFRIRSF